MTESTQANYGTLYFDSPRLATRLQNVIRSAATAIRGRRWRDPLAIGFAATALNSIGSWIPSKWNDEIATQDVASRTLPQIWSTIQNIDAVHGLYYAFMHFWMIAFGTSNLALRAPSLIAVGIAASGVVVLGEKLATRRVAITSGIVFMLLPRVTWMAIEARSLATTAAVSVWLTVILVSLVERRRPGAFVAYAALGAVGVTLNIYLALLVVCHGIALLVIRRRLAPARRLWLGWGGAVVFIVAVSSPIVRLASTETAQLPFGPLKFNHIFNSVFIAQFFSGATPVHTRDVPLPPTNLWSLSALVIATIGWLCILAPIVVRRIRPDRGARPLGLVLVCALWALVPPVIVLTYSALETPIYNARYFSFATPAVALLIGVTLAHLVPHRAKLLGALGIFALVVAPLYVVQRTPTAKNGSDWQQAAAIVQAHASPGQDIYYGMTDIKHQKHLSEIASGYPAVLSSLHNISTRTTGIHDSDIWGVGHLLPHLAPKLASAPILWAVLGHDGRASPERSTAEVFIESQGLHLVHIWRGSTTDVLYFSRAES